MRIAIDTGGTFTDCVYFAQGRLHILKLASTPDDPARAILQAIEQIANRAAVDVRHGTTVGTNALLERKGARTAFVTTAGFEDTLGIGRQARPELYNLAFEKEPSLVPEDLCFGVSERIAPDGSVLRAPGSASLERLRESIRAAAPESIAVSLLFSFANPRHEHAVAEALRELEIPLSLSHEVLPEFREYERGSTVVINAYLAPKMRRYLGRLVQHSTLHVMQSSGGIIPAAIAMREPVRTILSGPAGGVVGAVAVARAAGFDRILTFDMGGTSTDVALVDGERGLPLSTDLKIMGMPMAVPALRIHTVGAGGGSIASFDRGGGLQVGPQSAGADPGPACYGRGERITVTDANLLRGRLHQDGLLDGAMHLDMARARQCAKQARGVIESVERFAEGIVRLIDTNMEQALRTISVESGYDPREFTLVSFGGAGPLHACALAQALEIPRVLVPHIPGALSAYGILVSDVIRDYSRTVMLTPGDPSLDSIFLELETVGHSEMLEQGLEASARRQLSLRYPGQGFELLIDALGDFVEAFHQAHQKTYGYCDRQRPVEIVTVRVQMIASGEKAPAFRAAASEPVRSEAKEKSIYYRGEWCAGAIHTRTQLSPGDELGGPTVITEYSSTTFIPPGCRARVDELGNLIISITS